MTEWHWRFECQHYNDKLNLQGVNICDSLEIRVGGHLRLIHNCLQVYIPHLHFVFWRASCQHPPLRPQISPPYFCLLLHLFKHWLNLLGYGIECEETYWIEQIELALNCADKELETETRALHMYCVWHANQNRRPGDKAWRRLKTQPYD